MDGLNGIFYMEFDIKGDRIYYFPLWSKTEWDMFPPFPRDRPPWSLPTQVTYSRHLDASPELIAHVGNQNVPDLCEAALIDRDVV